MGKEDLRNIIRIKEEGKEHDRLLIEAAKEWGLSITQLIDVLIDLEVYIGIITVEKVIKLREIMDMIDRDRLEMV